MITNRPQGTYDSYMMDPSCDMYDYLPYLRSVAAGNILEIGVRKGVSTAALLLGVHANGGHVWSIDISASCGKEFEGENNWTFIHGNTLEPDTTFPYLPDQLDVLLIDGDHSYGAVAFDLKFYSPLVRTGGLILCHDVNPPEKITPQLIEEHAPLFGLRRAFDEYVNQTGYTFEILPGKFGLGVITKGN